MKTKEQIIINNIKSHCQKNINHCLNYIQKEEEDGEGVGSENWANYHNQKETYEEILNIIGLQTNEK